MGEGIIFLNKIFAWNMQSKRYNEYYIIEIVDNHVSVNYGSTLFGLKIELPKVINNLGQVI